MNAGGYGIWLVGGVIQWEQLFTERSAIRIIKPLSCHTISAGLQGRLKHPNRFWSNMIGTADGISLVVRMVQLERLLIGGWSDPVRKIPNSHIYSAPSPLRVLKCAL